MSKSGFTLIEFLLVISIIAILATIGASLYLNVQKAAKIAKNKADIEAIAKAYEVKYDPTNKYQPLAPSDFNLGQIPAPYPGGSYTFAVGPDNLEGRSGDTGFTVCASLIDDNACYPASETCYCRSSTQEITTVIPPINPTVSPTPSGSPPPACTPTDSNFYAMASFIHAHYDPLAKDYLFNAAARTGKKFIRFDFGLSIIEPNNDNSNSNTSGTWSWAQMDDMVTRAKSKGFTVVGVIHGSAAWIAAPAASPPPPGFTYNQYDAPIDRSMITNGEYAEHIRQIANHFKGPLEVSYWEIWNEPNADTLYNNPVTPLAYVGGPYTYADFAELLRVAYDTIKAADPTDTVLFPGVMVDTDAQRVWAGNLINHPSAQGKYNIGNAHIRGTLSDVQSKISQVVGAFPGKDVWITEHGYDSNPEYQWDPAYRGGIGNYLDDGDGILIGQGEEGDRAQADFYKQSFPILESSGADKVFVTLRDFDDWDHHCDPPFPLEQFCLEGLVTLNQFQPNYDRPSMCVFQNAGSILGTSKERDFWDLFLDIFR